MGAAKNGKSTLGIPAKVGADFLAATPKGAKLPERVGKNKSNSDRSRPLGDEF